MPFFGIDTVSLLITAFWVWMLIDCLFNPRVRSGGKLCWSLFILFTQAFGAICYFIVHCYKRNPLEAFPYYLSRIKATFQSWGFTPSSSYTPPSRSQPQQPRRPQPSPHSPYTDYTQGYKAQNPAHPARPMPSEQSAAYQPYEPQSAEPEYEQTMASYPEMELPPQEQ
ncbi:MAG TPA: PLD nuclease N-terminal domain-containing protein [Ktedonobacteraceae bacterium]|nr:PLD nuclease N-terminal domain-containing protein [Ktedonobacteraceae bacterium]